jgi:putative ABC transport system substrate-binding protein
LTINPPDLFHLELTAFKESLGALGWKDGGNVVIEVRVAGNPDRLPLVIEVLALKKAAVIVTSPLTITNAVAKSAPGIPVVQVSGPSPVGSGLAASLARPDGMVTGLTNLAVDLVGKHSELLVDVIPGMRRIGYLFDSNLVNARIRWVESARRAAALLNVEPVIAEAGRGEELEGAFAQLRKGAVQGIVVLPATYLVAAMPRITQLALSYRLPTVVNRRESAEAGALLSYGHDPTYNGKRAAWYVDRILRGTKPGDLPIEQPSRLELVVNLKTAKALGITVPQTVMVRADRVIQ